MDSYIFWLLTAAYAAHVVEEYSLDWRGWVRGVAGMDITWGDFFVTNGAVMVLGFCCAMIGWSKPVLSLAYPALMIINAVFFHILPAAVKRMYSPGMLTAVLLFIPLAGFCFYLAWRDHGVTAADAVYSFMGGAVIMAYPLLIQRLKRKMNRERS